MYDEYTDVVVNTIIKVEVRVCRNHVYSRAITIRYMRK